MRPVITLVVLLVACDESRDGDDRSLSAVPLDATAVRARVERAQALKERHRGAEAIELLEPLFEDGQLRVALGDVKLSVRTRSLYAGLLLDLSRIDEAVSVLHSLSEGGEVDQAIALNLARACRSRGDTERALAIFERLPPDARRRNAVEHARALLDANRPDVAVARLASTLIRDPWQVEPYLHLGRALSRRGDEELAEVFLKLYRYSEAHRRAEQRALALEQEEEPAAALAVRAAAELERGNLFGAMVDFNRAIQANGTLGGAYLELAQLSLSIERPRDALEALLRLPENPRVKELRELARSRLEEDPAASAADPVAELRARVRRALDGQKLGEGIDALARLAIGLWQLGERREARQIALFLAGMRPHDPRVTDAVLTTCPGPADLFHRLRVLRFRTDPEFVTRFERELGALGLEPRALRE